MVVWRPKGVRFRVSFRSESADEDGGRLGEGVADGDGVASGVIGVQINYMYFLCLNKTINHGPRKSVLKCIGKGKTQ